jgi:Tol biopolymer transport system component
VAWVRKLKDANGALKLAAVEIADLSKTVQPPRQITAARDARAHDERWPAWSPDSRSLAFRSDAAKAGQAQVWVVPAAGGPPKQITHVTGQISDVRWSPDGRSIAFLFVEGSAQETGALTAYKPDAGVVLATIEEQRIAVVDVASGKVRQVSPANLYV